MADNRLLPYSAAQFAPYQPGYTDLTGGAYTNPLSVSYPSWMTDAGARGIGNAFTPDTGTDAATQTAVGTDPTFAIYAPAPAPVDTNAQQAAVMGGNTMPNGGGGNQPGGGGQYGPNSGSASGNYAGDTGYSGSTSMGLQEGPVQPGLTDMLEAAPDTYGPSMIQIGATAPDPVLNPPDFTLGGDTTGSDNPVGGGFGGVIGTGGANAAPAGTPGGAPLNASDMQNTPNPPDTPDSPAAAATAGSSQTDNTGDPGNTNNNGPGGDQAGGGAGGGGGGGDTGGGGGGGGGGGETGGGEGSGNNGGNGNFKGGILTKNKLLPDNDDRPQGKDNGIFSGHTGEGILTDKAVKFYGPAIVAKLNRLMVPKSAFR